jgi:hypothetical protein
LRRGFLLEGGGDGGGDDTGGGLVVVVEGGGGDDIVDGGGRGDCADPEARVNVATTGSWSLKRKGTEPSKMVGERPKSRL